MSSAEDVNRSTLGVVRELSSMLLAMAKGSAAVATAKAPDVVVNPEINLPSRACCAELEIIEWTADKRAKKWRITVKE